MKTEFHIQTRNFELEHEISYSNTELLAQQRNYSNTELQKYIFLLKMAVHFLLLYHTFCIQ